MSCYSLRVEKKSILISGGAGYIGSHTTHALVRAGYQPVVVDNLSTGNRANIPAATPFYEACIEDKDKIREIIARHSIQGAMHFAASIRVDKSVAQPLKYYRNNFSNSVEFFQACLEGGVRSVVFSSTAAVYGDGDGTPVKETAVLNPASPYGNSKRMVEQALSDLGKASEIRSVVLRYFNVAGMGTFGFTAGANAKATHLFARAAQTAAGKLPAISIFGTDYSTPDGTGVRDYIHVEDLAQAHVAAWRYLDGGGASCTLNCGYGKGYSVLEVIQAMKQVSNVDFAVKIEPRRAGDVGMVVADASRIRSVLQWKPSLDDLSKICRSAFEHEAAKP
jgi:UDP-glucose 4-epimerase